MRYLLLPLLFIWLTTATGQRQELIDEISDETCECLQKADSTADFQMSMGLCAVQAASARSREVEEILDIKMTSMDQFEKLGEVIAQSLIENCPYFLERMMEELDDGDSETEAESNESWSDMDAAAEVARPEYGGPENKEFITGPIPNTNGSGLSRPVLSGKILSIQTGLSNEILLKDKQGETHRLYLVKNVANAGLLRKGAKLSITYRDREQFHAGEGRVVPIKVITRIEK